MTISEKRFKEVQKLAARKDGNIASAARIMNSFYRYAGLRVRLVYRENGERTCNLKSTHEMSERESAWLERLNEEFKAYGLQVAFYGIYPHIVENPCGNDAIYTFFY